jgi:hypothetical protein
LTDIDRLTEVARLHRVVPLGGHDDTWRCFYCGHVFVSAAGFAVCPLGLLHDARVRILAPEGHPLHQATGLVVRTWSAAALWEARPVDMMAVPLAWPDGQVMVQLDERPAVRRGAPLYELPWTPDVTVRPGEVELIGAEAEAEPPLRVSDEVIREVLGD